MMTKRKNSRRKQRKSRKTPRDAVVLYSSVPTRRNPVHHFRRAVTRQFAWNPAAGIDSYPTANMQITFAPGGVNWRLGGVSAYTDPVPNATDFTNLYDQWRLTSVIVRFDCSVNAYSNSGIAYSFPLLYYVADYDDPNDLSQSQMLEYPQMRMHSFTTNGYKPFMAGFRPRVLNAVATSGFLNSYGPMQQNPWIRTTEFATPHYGLKFAVNANGASVNQTLAFFQLTVWLDFECTNPR